MTAAESRTLVVGFVCLGDQGAPMAQAVGDSPSDLHVWARRPQSLDAVALHGGRDGVDVCVELHGDVLAIQVRDDGVGGAGRTPGPGLTGLVDRVEAAGGAVTVTSPAGAGTVLSATLPVDVA